VVAFAALLAVATYSPQGVQATEEPSTTYEFIWGRYEDSPNAIFRFTDNETGITCYSQFETISCVKSDR
jgi:hypothetical protein